MENLNITLSNMRNYLKSKGWLNKTFPSMDSIVYFPKNNPTPDKYLFFPTEYDLITEKYEVNQILYKLSKITKDPIDDLKEEIIKYTHLPIDIMQLRLVSDLLDAGTIPLSLATATLSSLKELITAAATYETNPRKYHKRPVKLASDVYDNFILDQTKKGSFIFNIQTGNLKAEGAEETNITLYEDSIVPCPMERKVFERIQYTLQNIQKALLFKDMDDGIKYMLEPAIFDNMNANIFDALNSIFDEYLHVINKKNTHNTLKLESTIHFSPIVTPRCKSLQLHDTVTVSSQATSLLSYISNQLKIDDEESLQVIQLVGTFKRLSLYNGDPNYKGSATIEVLDNKDIKSITADLSSEYYNLALDAQKHGYTAVILGIPVKNPKSGRWTLEDIESLKLIKTHGTQLQL